MSKTTTQTPQDHRTPYNRPSPTTPMPTTLDIGNAFLFISGFLMIRTAYHDRNILQGYNLTGSLLLATGITFALIFYAQMGYWLSILLTLPNYGYWLVVVASLLKKRKK